MKPKSKLGNPITAVAGVKVVEQVSSTIPFLIKTAVILFIGYYGYKNFTDRFVKIKENSNLPRATITYAQAKGRADSIAGSIGLFSNDHLNVARQLGQLNYNDFVRVYNAFGTKRGTLLAGELNLIEWIRNQFRGEKLEELSLLTGGAFF